MSICSLDSIVEIVLDGRKLAHINMNTVDLHFQGQF